MNKISIILILFVAVIAAVMLVFLGTYITELQAYLISTIGRGWYVLGVIGLVLLSLILRK